MLSQWQAQRMTSPQLNQQQDQTKQVVLNVKASSVATVY
jgi:hypothetical protein